jgi:hypothetical protein
MRKGKAIDPDKLRLFCREHGGILATAKVIGYTDQSIHNAIKGQRMTQKMLDRLCNSFALAPDYFDIKEPVKEAALPKETLTVASVLCGNEKSVVDELVDEMIRCAAPNPKPTELPKMAVKQNLPRSYTWQEKTLAEMTGEDIARLAHTIVGDLMSAVTNEFFGMGLEIKLKKDGGKYGW